MSGRIEGPEAAAFAGGALVMLGAWLPWLTLFAGLQQYRGIIGIHGQVLFAGGALAIAAGVGMVRLRQRWVRWATVMLGLLLLGFTWWLLRGLVWILRHDVSAMLVPRAGPGLLVASVGIALVILGPGVDLAREGGVR